MDDLSPMDPSMFTYVNVSTTTTHLTVLPVTVTDDSKNGTYKVHFNIMFLNTSPPRVFSAALETNTAVPYVIEVNVGYCPFSLIAPIVSED